MKAKRSIAMILAALLASAAVTGCSSGGSSSSSAASGSGDAGSSSSTAPASDFVKMDPAGYPVCAEKYNVKALIGFQFPSGTVLWDSPNDIPFYKAYEEKTNVHVEWEMVSRADYKQRMNIMIASDDMPDFFMKTSGVTTSDLIKNGNDGAFVDASPYLEQYAPDLNKYLTEKDLTKSLKVGGGIWGMPYLYDSEGITISKIFFNTDWLTRVNKPMPKTVDEITETLRAFKAVAANDEMPIALYNTDGANNDDFFSWFGSAYGLLNRGNSNKWVDADPADSTGNTVRFWRAADSVKDVLKLEKQYYEEGLIPKNYFNVTDYTTQMNNALQAGKAGAHDLWTTVAGPAVIDKYITMDAPPAGSDGKIQWNSVGGKIGSRSSFIITKACEHPEALVGWANYFYTQDGALSYFLGDKDVSYTIDAEGNTTLTDLITKNPKGLSQAQAQYLYSLAGGGGNPGLATDQTFKGGETYKTSLDGNAKFGPYLPETIWESFPLSAEQASQLSTITADLSAVITEYEAKFVTGALDIDKDWDAYQKKLDQAGRQTYVKVYNEALAAINAG